MNIKDLVLKTTHELFPDYPRNNKLIIASLALKNIFNQPYYKDTYTPSCVAISKHGEGVFVTNYCDDVGQYVIERLVHSFDENEYAYPFYDWFENDDFCKNFIVNDDIFKICTQFKDILLEANSIHEYAEMLVDAQFANPQFIPTLYSFSYLFSENNAFSRNSLFFSDDIKTYFKDYKNFHTINSEIFKNSIYTYSSYHILSTDPKTFEHNWKNDKEKRLNEFNLYFNKVETFNQYIQNNDYEKQVYAVCDKVLQQRHFLDKCPDLSDIQYYYYEIKKIPENAPYYRLNFLLEESPDFLFKEQYLSEHKINIAPFCNSIQDSEEHDLKDKVTDFLFDYENTIKPLPAVFYGIPFLKEGLQCHSEKQYYIVAKQHNDTIGYLSFTSPSDSHVLKSISYVVVKDSHRQLGLATGLYEKAIELFDNNFIMTNSSYTEKSEKYLLQVKEHLKKKYPLLIIERDELHGQPNASFTKELNDRFVHTLASFEKNEPELVKNNLDKIVEFYKKIVNEYDGNNFNYYDYIKDSLEQLSVSLETYELHKIFEDTKIATNSVKNRI